MRATNDTTTTNPAEHADPAALLAEAPLPTILDLGKHLAAIEIAYSIHDERDVRDAGLSTKADAKEAKALLFERGAAVRDLISTIPAKSMADVAVQVAAATSIALDMEGCIYNEREQSVRLAKIIRMALSWQPIVAEAAGLDMQAMDWADQDYLRIGRFAGVECLT